MKALMLENVYAGLNVYEGSNARSEVYLSKEYFCEMYPTCVSSKAMRVYFIDNDFSTLSLIDAIDAD